MLRSMLIYANIIHNVPPLSAVGAGGRGGELKNFHCWQNGGTFTFWIFRVGVGGGASELKGGSGFFQGGAENLSHKIKNVNNCNNDHHVLYVLTIFKYLKTSENSPWTFSFWGNSLIEEGKYLVIEWSYLCVE